MRNFYQWKNIFQASIQNSSNAPHLSIHGYSLHHAVWIVWFAIWLKPSFGIRAKNMIYFKQKNSCKMEKKKTHLPQTLKNQHQCGKFMFLNIVYVCVCALKKITKGFLLQVITVQWNTKISLFFFLEKVLTVKWYASSTTIILNQHPAEEKKRRN